MIKHIHLKECDSTQDILKEQLPEAKHILVSCENQIAGRGRGNNSWLSMPGTLNFSFTLTPHSVSSFTSLEVSVLIALFFESKGVYLKLKWPNDLFNLQNKKCAGILLQGSQEKMLAGVGINLNSDNLEYGAIFENKIEINKQQWSYEISDFIIQNRINETQKIKTLWEKKCCHLNSTVKVIEGSEDFIGKFIGLGEYGEALLETEHGIQKIFNGTLRDTKS